MSSKIKDNFSKISADSAINLVARFLNASEDINLNETAKTYDAAREFFLGNLYSIITNSECPDRKTVIDQINNIFDRQMFYVSLPQLVGKRLVGLLGFDSKVDIDFLQALFGKKIANQISLIQDTPVLIYSNGNNVNFINDANKKVILNSDELKDTCKLGKFDIDITSIINYATLPSDFKFENLVFVYLSKKACKRSNQSRIFLDQLDICAFIKPDDFPLDNFKFPRHNRYSTDLILERSGYSQERRTLSFSEFPVRMLDEDFSVHNEMFSSEIECQIYIVQSYLMSTIGLMAEDINLGASDLVRSQDHKLKESVTLFMKERQKEKTKYETMLEQLKQSTRDFIRLCKENENILGLINEKIKSESTKYLDRTITALEWLFLRYIDLNLLDKAIEIKKLLNLYGSSNVYVCDLLISEAKNTDLKQVELKKLINSPNDDEFLVRSKIRLNKYTGFTTDNYISGKLRLVESDVNYNKEELFYYALSHKKNHFFSYISGLRQAASMRYQPAVDLLVNLAMSDDKIMSMVGYDMIPELNYNRAVNYERTDKKNLADIFYKLAASQGDKSSILILIERQLKQLTKNSHDGLSDADKEQAKTCIGVMLSIMRNGADVRCHEILASFYELIEDFLRAEEEWSKIDSPKANYRRGVLWMYDKIGQDLQLAESLLSRAAQQGYKNADEKLKKVREFIQRDKYRQQKRAAEQRRQYSRKTETSDYSTSSGSSCFITTAVCSSLGKPDDCDELMTLRGYRDQIKQKDPRMGELVEEYYRVAPLVIDKIDISPDAHDVYRSLWEKYISRTYDLIKLGDYKSATKIYIEMVCYLSKKYGVSLKDSVENILADMGVSI